MTNNPIALGMKQIQEQLEKLDGWSINEEKLEKEFRFADFSEARSFVNKLCDIAEKMGHHPDILWWYNKVRVELFTHQLKALSNFDFILAGEIDKIA
jgi:4a-hydroxytetrahydrobiopterin dehydratase